METPHPPQPAQQPATPQPDAAAPQPVTPQPDAATQPAATPLEECERGSAKSPQQPPTLTLWELMRKEVPDAPVDAGSDILANPRPSIWDID